MYHIICSSYHVVCRICAHQNCRLNQLVIIRQQAGNQQVNIRYSAAKATKHARIFLISSTSRKHEKTHQKIFFLVEVLICRKSEPQYDQVLYVHELQTFWQFLPVKWQKKKNFWRLSLLWSLTLGIYHQSFMFLASMDFT